jgi:hypothetical protein
MLKGVKAELSPKYKAPELVTLPYEYVVTNDKIIEENDYNFKFETEYLENYEKQKQEEEEKRKQELKTLAPGLTDKVLEPVRVNSQDNLASNKKPEQEENKPNKTNSICVSDFEDVPPLDPWDKSKTNQDELMQLQMELNNNTSPKPNNANLSTNNYNNSATSSPSMSAQSNNMSYSSTYQNPMQQNPMQQNPMQQNPMQQNSNTSPGYSSMNQQYRPPIPPHPMYGNMPYPPYQNTYPGPSDTSSSYLPQSMPQPVYQTKPYTSAMPPPIPSRPNVTTTPANSNDAIVNSIVDMGFQRELVLNGMRNYGNDKRKVIDYVMLYSYLEGRGFQPKHIDTAIFLYSFNREKCEKFLTAFMELSEMGFDPEEIKEALIFSENDREAAIDQLTKST